MSKLHSRICIVVASLLVFASPCVRAQATTDPQVAADNAATARLNAETARINAENTNVAAKYGTPATAPTGTITNPDKFSALTQWAHAQALGELGETAFTNVSKPFEQGGKCFGKSVFVTSVADGRPAAVVASSIKDQLEKFTAALKEPKRGPSIESLTTGVAAIRGAIGTLDSLVGLFRADYTIADMATTSDDLALRMKVGKRLADTLGWPRVRIDGLSRAPVTTLPLMTAYGNFDTARADATTRNKSEKDPARKAELAAIIAAADAFDKAITTQPTTAGGQSPLVAAALALDNPQPTSCVLFVTYSIATSAITRKRLLSRNDHVTAAMGGLLKLVLFDDTGAFVVADVITLKSKLSQDLKELEK
jgi:hypothetical protein